MAVVAAEEEDDDDEHKHEQEWWFVEAAGEAPAPVLLPDALGVGLSGSSITEEDENELDMVPRAAPPGNALLVKNVGNIQKNFFLKKNGFGFPVVLNVSHFQPAFPALQDIF